MLIDKVKLILQNDANVEFAYIFGSYADNTFTDRSDIDIAVYFKEYNFDIHLSLSFRISQATTKDTDLVVLNKAKNLYLLDDILRKGVLLKDDEDISFRSEIEMSNNISEVEKSYVSSTTAEVSAEIFKHWKFDEKFIENIKSSDDDSTLLNIVKTVVCVNKPFSEVSINIGLQKAKKAGYDADKLQDAIDRLKEVF